ncbi:MAG: hydrogenase nickel incorporation protein HypB [Gammaproteobacteria bacterium]|nr:hydrogenase nickel incorporation protein HypB [Gammaproteobacteria bacterium]
MCTTCGCGDGHEDHPQGHAPNPLAPWSAPAPLAHGTRLISLEVDVLEKNDRYAAANRAAFASHAVQAINLMSSPGSGKTSLLVRTIEAIRGTRPVAVIEGDQETARDAERIRATGAPATQINTGKGCHLDAEAVGRAVATLAPAAGGVLFIENVGNLVCPAAFDLGEAAKVVVLSVTEGEDKPLKYPEMFRVASLLLLNKADLLPYVDFDVDFALQCARRVNPGLTAILTSAKSGAGIDEWLDWIERGRPPRIAAVR